MTHPSHRCRSCGSGDLDTILELGSTPLANSLLTRELLDSPEERYPLNLVFCPQCALVQIDETVSPEKLFREYVYFSSFSTTMLQHAKSLVEKLIAQRRLGPDSLVMEIASNDGYLLQYYLRESIPVLGIEPAVNIARTAEEKGIQTLCEFFGSKVAADLVSEGRLADVMHANNVLAHVADLNGVIEGFARVLKPGGVVVSESPYVKDLIDGVEFDTIYHEHLCYYSLTALDNLFARHGLVIYDAERIPIHGGSLRIYAAREGACERTQRTLDLLAEEEAWGVRKPGFYGRFASRVETLRGELTGLLERLRGQGSRIAAYGASAKGSTLLNCFGINGSTIEFVADRSTVKQGLYTPGTHLPICSPERLVESMPDYVLLLTWNFADEILEQQADYRQRGGRFIIPIPEVRVV